MKILSQWITQKRWFRSLAFSLGIFALIFVAQNSLDTLRTMEFTALNHAYTKRTKLPINSNISFWNINDDDLPTLRWPWGWDRFAQMAKTLKLYGAKMAIIQEDIFSNAGNPTISEKDKDQHIEKLQEVMENKAALTQYLNIISSEAYKPMAQAMSDWPNMILSQYFLIPDHQNPADIAQRKQQLKNAFLTEKMSNIEIISKDALLAGSMAKDIFGAININPLNPHLVPLAKGIGFMRIVPDDDGVIRQVPTTVQYDGKLYFSQPVVAAAAYFGVPTSQIEFSLGKLIFRGHIDPKTGQDWFIPVDNMGKMYVNWTSAKQLEVLDSAPFIAIKQLITWDMLKDLAKGRSFENIQQIIDFKNENLPKLLNYGWSNNEYLNENIVRITLCSMIEKDILEKKPWSITSLNYKAFEQSYDLDVTFNSLALNNLIREQWTKNTQCDSYENILNNPQFGIHSDRLFLMYLEKFCLKSEEDLEILTNAGFIAQDDTFDSENVRVIIQYLDWTKEKWITELVIKSGLEKKKLMEKFSLFFDFMQKRKVFLRNGYEQTLFHLKHNSIDQVHPLYFQTPSQFTDDLGRDRQVRLTDYYGKSVFIGLTATGLNALNPTPYAGRLAMAALTPTAFNTITTGAFIRRLDWVGPISILIYALITFLLAFYLPAYLSLPLTCALAAGHYFSGLALLNYYGLIVPLIIPMLATLAAYVVANIYIYIEQQRERQKIRGMFAAMVSPEVLKIMEEEPDKFNLRGEKVEASMFSSDVSGFTSISEGVTAQELALILNLYLTPMSNLVMTYGGYVEKYEGDAIKADFGMPLPDPDHAWKACFSSILQQEELQVVQRMLQLKYGVMITARMGVNTGVVNAGNMGSINKMQYCAIGEEVAMAEELEPSNKMWETWIAISPECLRLSGDCLETRMLDVVEYPHVTIPVYELLGWKKDKFLTHWKGKPIPKLVIEGWERIIPEKILAYIDYYHRRTFKGNSFYGLLISTFESLERACLDFMKLNDNIEIAGLEKRYIAQLKNIDAQGLQVKLEELDPVDRRELEGLIKNRDQAKEDWLKLLNGYLVELKLRTHIVNRFGERMPQTDIDELLTGIDTLEKNCNCYIKRNKFPTPEDRYGLELRTHLVSVLPNPSQSLSDEQLAKMRIELKGLSEKITLSMTQFIVKAKTMPEDYHVMMAEHGVLSDKKRHVCEIFAQGRTHYLKREWDEAIALFKQGLALVPDDGPCMKFIERCEKFKKSAPKEGWDGTWIANW